jgi:alpha-L-fucosidase
VVLNERLSLGPYKENDPLHIDPRADYRTPEQRVGAFDMKIPWETCMTLGTQWSWKPADTIKTAGECVRILVGCATGDGNLLLDVGPMPDGRIEPRQVSVLREIGLWLKRYGESIYGTRGGPIRNGTWGGATQKGNIVYLHIVRWDSDRVTVPLLDANIMRSTVLTGGEANITRTADSMVVRISAKDRDRFDTIVRLELDGPAGRAEPVE